MQKHTSSTVRSVWITAAVAATVGLVLFVAGLNLGSKKAPATSAGSTGVPPTNSAPAPAPIPSAVHYTGIITEAGDGYLTVILPGQQSTDGKTPAVRLGVTSDTVVTAKVFAPTVPQVPSSSDAKSPDAPPKLPEGDAAYKVLSITAGDLIKLDLVSFDARVDGEKLTAEKIEWLAHVKREPAKDESPELDTTNRFEGTGTVVPPAPVPEGADTSAPPRTNNPSAPSGAVLPPPPAPTPTDPTP